MRYFSTYFDVNYLTRAMCLLESIETHSPDFIIFMLCLDEESYLRLKQLNHPKVVTISLSTLEAADTALASTRVNRTQLEYYYTCGPAFMHFLLQSRPEIDILTSLDADTFFYSDPSCLFTELSGYSVGVTVHRFAHVPPQGRFNVGWISVRQDETGRECISWWRERCIEWCYERFESGRYADQKYLEEWPIRFDGVKVFQNPGVNVASWNVGDYSIKYEDDKVLVNGSPVVLYHFHGFKQITGWLYSTNLGPTFRYPSRRLIKHVYEPYIKSMRHHSNGGSSTRSIRHKHLRHPVVQTLRNLARIAIGIVFRQYLVVFRDRVY